MIVSDKKLRRYLYLGLIFKVSLSVIFFSDLEYNNFGKFVEFFVSGQGNPYSFFYLNNHLDAFPYPAAMLYVKSIANILPFSSSIYLGNFYSKLPLLLADLYVLKILLNWVDRSAQDKVMILYWLSPVLIFISYIHGQLDVLPILFLFISFDLFFKNKIVLAGIVFGLAISTKTNIVLILPFMLYFLLLKEASLKSIVNYSICVATSFCFINLPFLFDFSFYQIVFFNSQQARVLDSFLSIGDIKIYLLPLAYLLLLSRLISVKVFSKDVFLMFTGVIFGIFLLFMEPSPGWYYWFLPFMFYFLAKSPQSKYSHIFTLQLFYLIYFVFLPGIQNIISVDSGLANLEDINGFIFTLLQGLLAINCYILFRDGFSGFDAKKLISQPFLLGVGGNSGVGKTTLSNALSKLFFPSNSVVIKGDDMHRWKRGDNNWKQFTHLDPKANNLHQEITTIQSLKLNQNIERSFYDHTIGDFTEPHNIYPKGLTIYEGLHPFYLERQRDLFDFKIFIDPEDSLMQDWKIERDVHERGHEKEKIIDSIREREEDANEFILSQKKWADMHIRCEKIDKSGGANAENIKYKISLPNSLNIEPLLEKVSMLDGIYLKHNYDSKGIHQISFFGKPEIQPLHALFRDVFSDVFELNYVELNEIDLTYQIVLMMAAYSIVEEAIHG